jgi:hypothetical protein
MFVLSAPIINPSPEHFRFDVKLTTPCTTSPHAGFVTAADAGDVVAGDVVAGDVVAGDVVAGDVVPVPVEFCACAIRVDGWIAKPITAARDTIVATMYDIIVRFIQMTARK